MGRSTPRAVVIAAVVVVSMMSVLLFSSTRDAATPLGIMRRSAFKAGAPQLLVAAGSGGSGSGGSSTWEDTRAGPGSEDKDDQPVAAHGAKPVVAGGGWGPPRPRAPASAAGSGGASGGGPKKLMKQVAAAVAGELPGVHKLASLVNADPFAAAPAVDLAAHTGDSTCWAHFDFGMLQGWEATAQVFCAPPGMAAETAAKPAALREAAGVSILSSALGPYSQAADGTPASWLVCRVHVDEHLPGPTAPHTMCDGANIVLDVSKMTPSTCLVHRPGYKCDGEAVFWHYSKGAVGGACARSPEFTPFKFPRDHLMDVFSSFDAELPPDAVAAAPTVHRPGDGGSGGSDAPAITLLVTRERGEHANPFHATTDFLNAFFTLHNADVLDGVAAAHDGRYGVMSTVQVLLLDEQSGPFEDTFWKTVFSPAFPVLRVSSLQAAGLSTVRFPRALFVPPGYTNMLLAHVTSEGDCHARTQLFQSFRRFVLSAFGLDAYLAPFAAREAALTAAAGGGAPPLNVTLISRRPYHRYVDHAFIGRQLDNEEEVAVLLRSTKGPGLPPIALRVLDFAQLDVAAQIEAIASTEVLVGMHGAALTYALYLPPHAAVLELWPKDRDMWRCFEHISAMAGLHYGRWENTDPSAFRSDAAGDYTRVNLSEFEVLYKAALEAAAARRAAPGDTV